MSNPIKINNEAEYNNFVLSKVMEKLFEAHEKASNSLCGVCGGLVCGTVYKGESIINKRSISAIANIKELQ